MTPASAEPGTELTYDIVDLGPLSVLIRPKVAWRTFFLKGSHYCYLSLLDHEVDHRVASFLARVLGRHLSPSDMGVLGFCLEPTDAVIAVNRDCAIAWRGGACAIPLFWQPSRERIFITTRLPHPSERGLSRRGLIASFATVAAALQNDQNLILRSPVAGWIRLRRGAATRWSISNASSEFAEEPIDFAAIKLPVRLLSYSGIAEELMNQIKRFGETQAETGRAIFELSGGMDSTLAAWSVCQQGNRPLGVSISFPFYEFRYEDAIQLETAKVLDVERVEVDGRTLYAYSPNESRLSLDEPATICMIAKREETFAKIARMRRVDTILVGEGGDQLLSEHLFDPMRITESINLNVMQGKGCHALRHVVQQMRTAPIDYLRRSTLAFSHDARLALAVKQRWGVVTRSPFTDLGMAMCGIAYARWCAEDGFNHGKKIVAEAFADVLPAAILQRRGKVSWEGVYARTYEANERSLGDEFESCHTVLEAIGFDVQWLQQRVRALGRLEATDYGRDDREVMSAYAIAYWLNEKGVLRRADCDWVD